MSKLFKRTKILATVGPAVDNQETVREMVKGGVNGYRLNFSHGTAEEREAQIEWIRTAAAEQGKSVAIVQDLQGPKIRLGMLKDEKLPVKAGERLVLDAALAEHDGGKRLPLQYNLAEKVKVGETIYIFDGKVRTVVTNVPSHSAIEVEVQNDGVLMSKKGLNLPDTDFGGDVITEKDIADIEFGASKDFDYVAMSFVQSAEDIRKLRQILISYGSTAQIITKVETKKAIESPETMEEIVKETDGVMVARGDLAVEAGAEVVPVVQLHLTRLCRKYSKLCIVATQMMASMVEHPEPTRAEVSDVANAVMQGADAVMLSEETATGKYPLEAIAAMRKTILYTQARTGVRALADEPRSEHATLDAVADAAVKLAEKTGVDILVCETGTGATAENIAARRPRLPIVSVTDNQRVANQLSLCYANSSFVRPFSPTYGIDLVAELREKGYFATEGDMASDATAPGDGAAQVNGDGTDEPVRAIIVSGRLRGDVGGADTIQLRKI
jgi:pyruvate kinase